MKRRRGLSLLQKRNVKGFMFILPWLIGFIIFYARSMIMTAQFSLSTMTTSTSGGYTLEWAGLSNYIYAFRAHGTFKQVLTTSILNMLVDVPLITFFSLFMAILLNRRFKDNRKSNLLPADYNERRSNHLGYGACKDNDVRWYLIRSK